MKYLMPFRLLFVLLLLLNTAAWISASLEAYRDITVVVQNRSAEPMKFGINSWVKGQNREVFFSGDFHPFPLEGHGKMYIGSDENRDRIVGFYVERPGSSAQIACAPGFHHYRLEVDARGAKCRETRSRLRRWVANLPVSFQFIEYYGRIAKELLLPDDHV